MTDWLAIHKEFEDKGEDGETIADEESEEGPAEMNQFQRLLGILSRHDLLSSTLGSLTLLCQGREGILMNRESCQIIDDSSLMKCHDGSIKMGRER